MYNSESLPCGVISCDVQCSDTAGLTKHLRQHIKDGTRITCPIKGCQRQYKITLSFSCHLSRDHVNWNLYDVMSAENIELQVDFEGEDVDNENTEVTHATSQPCDEAIDSDEGSPWVQVQPRHGQYLLT